MGGVNSTSFVNYGMWEFLKSTLFRTDVLIVLFIVILCIYLYYKFNRKKKIYFTNPVHSFLEEFAQLHKATIGDVSENVEEAVIPEEKPKRTKKEIWKNEERCRQIFQKLFDKPFESCRPDFLKNPVTGSNLEIDGYNEELKLGMEVQGKQHSEFVPYFHRKGGAKEFEYQVKKDDYKAKKCKLEGIDLICIPHYISPDHLEKYIVREIRKIKRFKDYSLNTYEN